MGSLMMDTAVELVLSVLLDELLESEIEILESFLDEVDSLWVVSLVVLAGYFFTV